MPVSDHLGVGQEAQHDKGEYTISEHITYLYGAVVRHGKGCGRPGALLPDLSLPILTDFVHVTSAPIWLVWI